MTILRVLMITNMSKLNSLFFIMDILKWILEALTKCKSLRLSATVANKHCNIKKFISRTDRLYNVGITTLYFFAVDVCGFISVP